MLKQLFESYPGLFVAATILIIVGAVSWFLIYRVKDKDGDPDPFDDQKDKDGIDDDDFSGPLDYFGKDSEE